MATVITDEQRIEVRKASRFEDMTRASVSNYASFIHNNNGDTPPGGMSKVEWAMRRFFIAESILQNPNAQDIEQWKSQYVNLMKGMTIWNGDVDATIDFMISSNTFETLADSAFGLKAANVKF